MCFTKKKTHKTKACYNPKGLMREVVQTKSDSDNYVLMTTKGDKSDAVICIDGQPISILIDTDCSVQSN